MSLIEPGEYAWRSGRQYGVSAAVYAAVLHDIERRDGRVTPQAVVEAARPEGSPIHDMWGGDYWEDEVMAEEERKRRVRGATRALVIVRDDESRPQTAYVSAQVVVDDRVERGYHRMAVVLGSEDLYQQALRDVVGRLRTLRDRHDELVELKAVWEEIDKLDAAAEAA